MSMQSPNALTSAESASVSLRVAAQITPFGRRRPLATKLPRCAQRCYRVAPIGALASRRVRAVCATVCSRGYTVSMVVDRQSADVKGHCASPLLGRAWDARGGEVVGHAGR